MSSLPARSTSTAMMAVAVLVGSAALPALATFSGTAADDSGDSCDVVNADWTATARVDKDRTELFGDYGNSGVGWTGGDSTYSVRQTSGRQLWLFSDTFLGPVNDDLSRPIDTPFLNNSFIVQRGDELSTVTGGTPGDPDSLVPPDEPSTWNWLGAATGSPHFVDVMFLEFGAFGPGQWDWAWRENKLVRFDPDSYQVRDIVPMPSEAGVQWASWIERFGEHTYIYGVEDHGLVKYMHLARVAGADLTAPWEYWTGDGWSPIETDSVAITSGVANEYSVSSFHDGYLLVTQDTNELFSRNIVGYVSCHPWGPFVPATTLYFAPDGLGWDLPEPESQTPRGNGRAPSKAAQLVQGAVMAGVQDANPNIITYNAHEHPELRRGNRLLITYNVNSLDPNVDLYADVTIYRPRFVEVELSAG
ncbi:MAG TPA: hypothetical protein VFZ85_01100 [Jiangellaceae bacterium]